MSDGAPYISRSGDAFAYNRRGEVASATIADNATAYAYDHLSRRVRKTTRDGVHTYFYDGWNLVLELIEHGGVTNRIEYVWGKDISGTLQGAGGIGGSSMSRSMVRSIFRITMLTAISSDTTMRPAMSSPLTLTTLSAEPSFPPAHSRTDSRTDSRRSTSTQKPVTGLDNMVKEISMKIVLAVMILVLSGCSQKQSEAHNGMGVVLHAEDGCVLKVADRKFVMGKFGYGFWHLEVSVAEELEKFLPSSDLCYAPVGLVVSPSMTFDEFRTILEGISCVRVFTVYIAGDRFGGICVTHLPLFASPERYMTRQMNQTCLISLLDEHRFSAKAQQGRCDEKCTNVYERAIVDVPLQDSQNELPYIELACRPSTRMDRVLDYFSAVAKRGYKKVFLREWLSSPFWTSEY